MIALAYAGGLGLAAVILFVLAALTTIRPVRAPWISAALAVAALLVTIAMTLTALYGVFELALGVLS